VIVKRANFVLSLYLLAAAMVFVLVALPVLEGRMDFQFYFDSVTYHEMADRMDLGWNLVQVGGNFLGPLLIIKMLGASYVLIFLFNVSVFVASYLLVARNFPVDRAKFLVLLCISPLMFVGLLSVNKEIVAVFVTVLFASSYAAERPVWRWIALVLSIIARWQMTVALAAAAFLLGPLNPLRRRRLLSLVGLVTALSIAYPLNLSTFEGLDLIAREGARQATEGSGLYFQFIQIQNHLGGYVLVFVPKALHLFVGTTRRWYNVLDFSDIPNNVTLWLQSLLQLAVLVRVLWLRRFRLSSDAVYLASILAALIALSPIFTTRYLLPVYVLLALELATPRPMPMTKRRMVAGVAPVDLTSPLTPVALWPLPP
jgi:hypothetical protein